MPKPWTEHKYLEAIGTVGNVSDPDLKAQLEQRIRQYERSKGPGFAGAATGIEAFEERTGMSLPSDRKTRDAEHAESVNPKTPDVINEGTANKQPPVIKGSLLSTINRPTWYEPTLEEFQAEMGPVLGPDEAAVITEDSDLFRRYADAKWAQAYDAAKASGESLLRVKDIPTETLAGKAVKGVAEFERYAKPVQHAVEEGITGGLAGNARARFNEATGLDRNAVEELERERARLDPKARAAGNIAGVLMPGSIFNVAGKAASKLAAPVAGALIVKGGGKAIPRALGRGGVAVTAGGAGMAAQGAAEDIAREGIAKGENPFDLDFLGRRGMDFGIGAAAGAGSEVLGTAMSRLGRLGPVQRAKDTLAEGAANTRLNPLLAAGGGAALGASFQTIDNDQRAFNMLVGASVGLGTGMGASLGRYALLNHLAKSAAVAGEPAFKGMAKRLSAAPLAPDTIGAIRSKMLEKGNEVFGGKAAQPAGRAIPAVPATPGIEPRFVDVSQPGSRARGRRTPGEGETPMGARPPRKREVFLPGKPGQPAQPEIPGTPAIPAQPPQTGAGGGGMFGIPFTGGADAAQPTTLSPDEAEAFILDLIEEDRLEQEKLEASDETSDEEPLEETDDEGNPIQPIGFGAAPFAGKEPIDPGLILDATSAAPDARRSERDPEFQKWLMAIKESFQKDGVPEEDIADALAAQVRNYPTWRESQDELGKEHNNPRTLITTPGRYKGTETKELGTLADERIEPIPAELRPTIEKRLKAENPQGYSIEQVVDAVVRNLSASGMSPGPDIVEESMRNLGFPMPKAWVKNAVAQRARREVSL